MTESQLSELLIATRNTGKIRELESLLEQLPLRLRSLSEFPSITDVNETGATFSENAVLKATEYARQTRLWSLGDDSGLEVDALGGAPGVFSARYGGTSLSDAERVQLLLNQLSKTDDLLRRARFVCVIVVADAKGEVAHVAHGVCEGKIAHAPRGTGGFGYDPVFIPDGYRQTFGELPVEIKQSISHRARAFADAASFLRQRLPGLA